MYYGSNVNMYYQEKSFVPGAGYNPHAGQKLPLKVEERPNQYVAMDCEMVGVGNHGLQSALARVTIISWYGTVLFDEYVKQDQEVTDYRTFVSGITTEVLDNEMLDFATCRKRVQELLKDKILVGHALENDLGVLNISHPWHLTRDTAKYEPFMKMRFNDGVLWPRGLRDLCWELLGRDIQVLGKPHCPREDALAALDLYRVVWQQWEGTIEYKLSAARAVQYVRTQHKPYQRLQRPSNQSYMFQV
jgi:RNA exonuclease 4